MATSQSPGSDHQVCARWIPSLPALLALLLGAGCATAADPAVAPFECAATVCGFNVLAPALRVAPCEGMPVLVAYSTVSGLSLVQCSVPGVAADQVSLLFDRANPAHTGRVLHGTRFTKPDAVADAGRDGLPGRFGPVPWCDPPEANVPATPGELLLLKLRPGTGADQAACHVLWRAQLLAGAVVVRGVDRGEAGAAGGAADGAAAEWQVLVAGLLPWLPAANPR